MLFSPHCIKINVLPKLRASEAITVVGLLAFHGTQAPVKSTATVEQAIERNIASLLISQPLETIIKWLSELTCYTRSCEYSSPPWKQSFVLLICFVFVTFVSL